MIVNTKSVRSAWSAGGGEMESGSRRDGSSAVSGGGKLHFDPFPTVHLVFLIFPTLSSRLSVMF